MTAAIRDTLSKYADDAKLEVTELYKNRITISVSLPSRDGETWLIRSDDVVHLDLSPFMILGHIEFGGLSLLPPYYTDSRTLDYGGESDKYRVIQFTDIDGKCGYLVLYGDAQIVRQGSG